MVSTFQKRPATDFIVVHCSATKASMDIGVQEIRQWHLQRGWSDIGYHKVIRRDGTVEDGRPLDVVGAHVEGFNSRSVGVCMVGGLSAFKDKGEDNFTPDQWLALKSLLRHLRQCYPSAKILGHRDMPKVIKDCPCFDVREWVTTNLPDLANYT